MKALLLGTIALMPWCDKSADRSKLYHLALQKYSQLLSKAFPDNKLSTEKNIYIISSADILLPKKIGIYNFVKIDLSAKDKLQKGQSLHAIKLEPIKEINGRFVVPLLEYIVKNNSDKMIYEYAGGLELSYAFDSWKRKYIFKKSKIIGF